MDNILGALLITSAVPFLLTVICIVTAVLAFVRQTELGAASSVAGVGFGALAAASAIKIGMLYEQLSGAANHTPAVEIARTIGHWILAASLCEIAGLVLVAVAIFQRRPGQPRSVPD